MCAITVEENGVIAFITPNLCVQISHTCVFQLRESQSQIPT